MRYGQPLPGTEAEPPPPPPPMSPRCNRRTPRSNAPGRTGTYGQIPAKVLAALQAHGTDGASHTLATAVVPYGQVWTSLDRLVKQGKAVKEGHPLSHHERRGMTDLCQPGRRATPEAIATLPAAA